MAEGLRQIWVAGAMTEVTRQYIEALAYLKDARKAAVYLGIPQIQVEDVWAEMPRPHLRANEVIEVNGSNGFYSYQTAREQATEASAKLREQLLSSMLRWANDNGTTLQEAGQFLLQGRVA